jgi:alkaline phosphatase/streptomycin-6-phosphatase
MRASRGSLAAAGALGVAAALAVSASFAFGGTENKTNSVRAALDGSTPKNVILFIGDGMGTQEITALRYYEGARNPLHVDAMPFTGFDTTWSLKPGAGPSYTSDYAPDSASTGTMWATGHKTIDERISQGPSTDISVPGENLKTALEWAQQQGKKVGDVSTAEVTDATPAVQASHISLRGCQGPANMASCPTETKAAGGLGSIAEQMVDHKLDVLLGGGRSRFTATIPDGPTAGKTPLQIAQDRGDRYVSTASELDAITDANKPVIGLFTTGNMTQEWTGPNAALGKGNAPTTCNEHNRPATEPSLSAMTSKAIELLDNPNGFFLQVEGASIDKRDHASDACGQLGETKAFDDAIGVALAWQQAHPDTLIIVTADHSHTSQIVADDASGTGLPTGYSTNLTTKEGGTLALTYGTVGFNGAGNPPVADPGSLSMQHTGAVVPVWAIGPQAANVLGTNDHTDLFDLIRFAKAPQSAPSDTVVVPGRSQTVTQTQTVTTPGPTVTVTAPSAPSSAPATPAFAATAAVGETISRPALRRGGLRVAVASTDDVDVSVRATAGGRTVATGSGRGSGDITVTARPTAAGKRTKAHRLAVRITLEGGGQTRTITRSVTVG